MAFFAETFPNLSETFVLNHVVGLLENGLEITVFAGGIDSRATNDPLFLATKKRLRLQYGEMVPLPRMRRLFWAISCVKRIAKSKRGRWLPLLDVFRYGREAYQFRMLSRGVSLAMRADEFDVAVCHFGFEGERVAALKRAGLLDCPLIVIMHAIDIVGAPRQVLQRRYAEMFESTTSVLTVCEYMADKVVNNLGCPRDKVAVHHVGVRMEEFPPCEVERKIGSKRVRLVTACRLAEKKGTIYLLRAAELVARKVPHKDLEVVIIGDGPERSRLEGEVERLGIEGIVEFTGAVSHKEMILGIGQADIFVLPSVTAMSGDQEGTPVVILEAMAQGIPTVATSHSGIPEEIVDGVSGLLVPERDSMSLAEAICRLIVDSKLYSKIHKTSRKVVEERFDQRRLDAEFVDRYVIPVLNGSERGAVSTEDISRIPKEGVREDD